MPEQVHVATADLPSSTALPRHDRCPACDAPLAVDQRYCVECGQGCGALRPPFVAGSLVQRDRPAPGDARGTRRPRMSVNSTLIAGVGTLLLAMGVGVLIGRSGGGASVENADRPAVQVVTVPVAGAGAAAGANAAAGQGAEVATSAASTGAKGASGAAKTTGAAGGSTATKAAGGSAATKAAGGAAKNEAPAPAKAVKVGSSGKGPGYQKGHFTGNFFGE